MDIASIKERLLPHWLPILLGLGGVIFLVYGLIALATPRDKQGEITFEAASDTRSASSGQASKEAETKQITVDVAGAVENPGVYELPEDARVQDALIAAGGMSSQADRERVARGLNLAAKLTDGGKLYIPAIGDPTTASVLSDSGSVVLGAETAASGMVNINTASSSELDKLQGVGPVTAEKIISNRPYGAIEELVSKKIVGQKVFEGIKGQISVY